MNFGFRNFDKLINKIRDKSVRVNVFEVWTNLIRFLFTVRLEIRR